METKNLDGLKEQVKLVFSRRLDGVELDLIMSALNVAYHYGRIASIKELKESMKKKREENK